MSCDCDYDYPEAQATVTRKARKAHHCDECGEPIQPREAYEYTSGIFDGSPFSFRLHAVCSEWRSAYRAWVRAEQEKAVLVTDRYERRFNSYVGSVPPVVPTAEEWRHALAVLELCDCVEVGGLAAALREVSPLLQGAQP